MASLVTKAIVGVQTAASEYITYAGLVLSDHLGASSQQKDCLQSPLEKRCAAQE